MVLNGGQVGVGLTMEGIRQNYIVYDLTLDLAWEDSVDLDSWVQAYAQKRY